MEFIGTAGTAGANARACMCQDQKSFANARGGIFTNTCSRCGCSCDPSKGNFNSNHSVALNTHRKS